MKGFIERLRRFCSDLKGRVLGALKRSGRGD